ncbi:MAG TPA: winged helix DNA-binding domain-containing protein [Prolixibacteraceae bacterium]|nr:winged helix DNA-binding domain-containing protein [Prolixibacteraceae bacterium]HPS12832.1 winged helix DNA-binding domain-containing protein [Prolixibacteraceae bacterium]
MKLTDISNYRVLNQITRFTTCFSADQMVYDLGAMQAQDFAMAKWALGARLPGFTEGAVESAFNEGKIIRTHLMRPTWHLVSADDIYWLNDLTAPKIKSSAKSRHRDLGLTDSLVRNCESIFEKAVSERGHLTREEFAEELSCANLKIESHQLYHLLFIAELDALLCSGRLKNGKQTYALLSERVPNRKTFSRDESLAELAKRYFTSRCPATIDDFIWWSGLSVSDAKRALEMIKSGFVSETIDSKTYWFTEALLCIPMNAPSVFLLPAFDEFLICYKDRSASLSLVDNRKVVSNNGIFYPFILVDGQVAGVWKRTLKNDRVIVAFTFFQKPDLKTKEAIEKEADRYACFLERKLIL